MKAYGSTKQGKAEFVKEVLSPLLYQAQTGWYGAEYDYDPETGRELVHLLTEAGYRSRAVNVAGDSCEAIIRDVFKNL